MTFSLGYPEGLAQKYRFGKELGQGGFGSVRVVEDIATGTQWACKSIKKRLEVPNVTPAAQARHLDNVKREVAILRRLRGTVGHWQAAGSLTRLDRAIIIMQAMHACRLAAVLTPTNSQQALTCAAFGVCAWQLNVVHLEDVFEDAESVHLGMEYCKGGELLHSLGKRPYSEGTVGTCRLEVFEGRIAMRTAWLMGNLSCSAQGGT